MRKSIALAALLAAASALPAQAVTFNLINTGGAEQGTKARLGFDIAAHYWSSVLTDNFTVNLQIGFRPLGPNILGSTGSSTGSLYVDHAYANLAADAKTAVDATAVANLKPLVMRDYYGVGGGGFASLDAITNGYLDPANRTGIDTNVKMVDNDGSANNFVLDTNTANLKALGITVDDDGNDISNVVDGSITFSSQFAFDFDPRNGIADNSYDFVGVAIHEIGHALGFVSGVDTYDFLGSPGSPDYGDPFPPGVTYADLFNAGLLGDPDIGDYRVLSTLDLFRYSTDGLDWSVGGTPFFSIDGSNQLFGASGFSTGQFNGDGSQASHWKDNLRAPRINPNCTNNITTPLGIMDPTIGACELDHITALDLAAFDAIGYDVAFNVLGDPSYRFSTADAVHSFFAVPEPGTWALMIAGFGFAGTALRRQRRTGYATA